MEKVIILTPVFNDWKSVEKLINKLFSHFKKMPKSIEILIVDDCSTTKPTKKISYYKNSKKLKILRLKKNNGSQKAIFFGLKYLRKICKKGIIVVMDCDGEDDYRSLTKMVELSSKNPDSVITGNRLKRNEGLFFNILYRTHLFLTYILTGHYLDFGNYSCFNCKKLKNILKNNNIYFAYSAGIKKNVKNLISCYSDRQKRFFGRSKVSFYFLFKHAINILTVFKKELFSRSIILLIIIFIMNQIFNLIFVDQIASIIIFINFVVALNFFFTVRTSYNHH